jgi:hypothetical protein
MYSDQEVELTLEERAALAALPREITPSDLLEQRVVNALKTEGHFQPAHRAAGVNLSLIWKIAAAIALFAGGVATGRYVMQGTSAQTASNPAPAVEATNPARRPAVESRPVQQNESVVAEREMWL